MLLYYQLSRLVKAIVVLRKMSFRRAQISFKPLGKVNDAIVVAYFH